MLDFELSSSSQPSRSSWNEDKVLSALLSPLSEPSFSDYYNNGEVITSPLPIPRFAVADLGGWKGGALVSQLRAGIPVIVTDAIKSFPQFAQVKKLPIPPPFSFSFPTSSSSSSKCCRRLIIFRFTFLSLVVVVVVVVAQNTHSILGTALILAIGLKSSRA